MCIQTARQGGRSYNSNGYLWHYYEHIVGMHFREAVETYPNNGDSPLSIPQADEDLYVDLGLPSGLLWATRNIDARQKNGFAKSSYQYGCSFFSWGNVDGHNPTSNTSFAPWDWGTDNNTEPYVSSPGSEITFPGSVDNKHDVAHIICGDSWRMPSRFEYKELLDNCSFIDAQGEIIPDSQSNKIITLEGNSGDENVNGILLKSKINGKTIFFPCCGVSNNSTLNNKANWGQYWTKDLYNETDAYVFIIIEYAVQSSNHGKRYQGRTIRPVMVPSRGRKSVPADQDPIKEEVPTK
jgi:uncharacterized protein (TIGR02145 family)